MKSEAALSLLEVAASCEAPLHISPAGKEEAEELLHFLTRKTYD